MFHNVKSNSAIISSEANEFTQAIAHAEYGVSRETAIPSCLTHSPLVMLFDSYELIICETDSQTFDLRIIYNLSHPDVTYMRSKVWESVSQTISAYEAGDMTCGECIRQLGIAVSRETPYSACAIACVNSLAPDEIKSGLDLTL